MSLSRFILSLPIPGFAYLLGRRPGAFAWVFVTVAIAYGVYAILLANVSSLGRSHAAWHVMASLTLVLQLSAAVHGAREAKVAKPQQSSKESSP